MNVSIGNIPTSMAVEVEDEKKVDDSRLMLIEKFLSIQVIACCEAMNINFYAFI